MATINEVQTRKVAQDSGAVHHDHEYNAKVIGAAAGYATCSLFSFINPLGAFLCRGLFISAGAAIGKEITADTIVNNQEYFDALQNDVVNYEI